MCPEALTSPVRMLPTGCFYERFFAGDGSEIRNRNIETRNKL
jgi:hypothetical protein